MGNSSIIISKEKGNLLKNIETTANDSWYLYFLHSYIGSEQQYQLFLNSKIVLPPVDIQYLELDPSNDFILIPSNSISKCLNSLELTNLIKDTFENNGKSKNIHETTGLCVDNILSKVN